MLTEPAYNLQASPDERAMAVMLRPLSSLPPESAMRALAEAVIQCKSLCLTVWTVTLYNVVQQYNMTKKEQWRRLRS